MKYPRYELNGGHEIRETARQWQRRNKSRSGWKWKNWCHPAVRIICTADSQQDSI